ncbi:MAG: fepA [Candidatus Brocadiaceae bacterium]|nr:fepA [Candidatus Brocadiaceae bacterium]
MLAYEVGYRIQPTKRLSFDIATFYNVYDGITNDVRDETFKNVYDGETYGIENTVNWAVSDRWKLARGYTYFHENLFSSGKSSFLADDPHNQFNIRSLINLPYRTELDTALFYVDGFLPMRNMGFPNISALTCASAGTSQKTLRQAW